MKRFLFLVIIPGFCLVAALFGVWKWKHSDSSSNLPVLQTRNNQKAETNRNQVFSWKSIETPDYRQYVTNLRNVGCPEATIEDVIVADVNSFYLESAKPILDELKRSIQTNYSGQPRKRTTPNLLDGPRVRLDELNKQRIGLVTVLLGHDVPAFKLAMEPWAASLAHLTTNSFPYLSDEQGAMVSKILESTLNTIRQKVPPGQAFDKVQAQYIDQMNRIAEEQISKILDPAAFKQYQRYNSPAAAELEAKLAKLKVSDEEFDSLLSESNNYYQKYGYFSTKLGATSTDPEAIRTRLSDEQDLNAKFKSILGEERFGSYQMENDPRFKVLSSFSNENTLTADQTISLYQTRRTTEEALSRLAALSPDEAKTAAAEILDEAKRQIAITLGEETGSKYLQSSVGQWMARLSLNPISSGGNQGSTFRLETRK